jgi:hypothetical protein
MSTVIHKEARRKRGAQPVLAGNICNYFAGVNKSIHCFQRWERSRDDFVLLSHQWCSAQRSGGNKHT